MTRLFLVAVTAPALLASAFPAHTAPPDIPILVDGVPLDARAVSVRGEPYLPAWILENDGKTKVSWMRSANVLEISTVPASTDPAPADGVLIVKIGGLPEPAGFSSRGDTRIFLLNVAPKDLRFPDGRTAAERARDGSVERIGTVSPGAREFLLLSPAERAAPGGWRMVSRMPKEEIAALPALVDRYEAMYQLLYYDLLMGLVMEMDRRVRESGTLDPALKGISIRTVTIGENGTGRLTVPPGIRFLYGRVFQGAQQVVWDVPVSVRSGGETAVELSRRNAAVRQ